MTTKGFDVFSSPKWSREECAVAIRDARLAIEGKISKSLGDWFLEENDVEDVEWVHPNDRETPYELIEVALREDNHEALAVYRTADSGVVAVWVRPVSEFVKRFEPTVS